MNEWMNDGRRKEGSTMTHQATVVGMDRERTETLVLLHTQQFHELQEQSIITDCKKIMNFRKFAMGKNVSLLAEEASATAMMRKASSLFCFMFLLFLHQSFNTVVAQPGELNFIFSPPKSFFFVFFFRHIHTFCRPWKKKAPHLRNFCHNKERIESKCLEDGSSREALHMISLYKWSSWQ